MKRIAVDLAKSVYQVAESIRSSQMVQRKRLTREAFRRYIQEQGEPVEWVMETCGTTRIGHNKAAVALANKLVRICWAVWCHERRFSGNWQRAKPA